MANRSKKKHKTQSTKKASDRLRVPAEMLYNVCAGLPIEDLRDVTTLLLKHAFLVGGCNPYHMWGEHNVADRRSVYLRLMNISTELADSWHGWASALSMEDCTCHHQELLNCIHVLVGQSFLLEPFD